MNYETAKEIEIAIAEYFGIRQNLSVPNVSWGIGIYECDVLVLTKTGYAYEVEIKISRSDLLRDSRKRHQHWDWQNRIRKFWFAIPEKLVSESTSIPNRAGVLAVNRFGQVREIRPASINASARKLEPDEQYKLARLGVLRMWALKKKVLALKAAQVRLPFDGEKEN